MRRLGGKLRQTARQLEHACATRIGGLGAPPRAGLLSIEMELSRTPLLRHAKRGANAPPARGSDAAALAAVANGLLGWPSTRMIVAARSMPFASIAGRRIEYRAIPGDAA